MDVKKKIQELINNNDICLFMKGTADSPQCGFSMAVSNVLKHLKADFKDINVLEDESLRQGIKDYSSWPTIPQIYIKDEFIGGCDILNELVSSGEIESILKEKEISFNV